MRVIRAFWYNLIGANNWLRGVQDAQNIVEACDISELGDIVTNNDLDLFESSYNDGMADYYMFEMNKGECEE